jgi:hypothetical protein
MINFGTEGLFTLHDTATRLLDTARLPRLRTLALVQLPVVDPPLLRLVARACPALEDLTLAVVDRLDYACCWECLADSALAVVHAPIPDAYACAADLAVRASPGWAHVR